MQIVIGTRGSKLAIAQTQWVIEQISKHYPEIHFEIQIITTKGDRLKEEPLDTIGGKGVFVKEIEEQLQEGRIDLAVHSMKDMPSKCPEELMCTTIPTREDRRDVLVLKHGIRHILELPVGATIATCSKRRAYQLLRIRPDFKIIPIRGNIDTRLKKMNDTTMDGMIIAAAGLKRLGLESLISYYMPEDLMVPSPAQGALGLQIRKRDLILREVLKCLAAPLDDMEIHAERGFLIGVGADCQKPVGATARIKGELLTLKAVYGTEEGDLLIKKTLVKSCKTTNEATKIGIELARIIMEEIDAKAR